MPSSMPPARTVARIALPPTGSILWGPPTSPTTSATRCPTLPARSASGSSASTSRSSVRGTRPRTLSSTSPDSFGRTPETRITWVIRNAGAVRVFTAESDELPDRAGLGAKVRKLVDFGVVEVRDQFEIVRLERDGDRAVIVGNRLGGLERFSTDVIVNATGFRPNLDMLGEIRLDLDEVVEAPRRLAPLIDPNVHSCGTVEPHGFAELQQPERNFFIAGMKSYGRAPTFLLATGYEQVRSITAWLAGDAAAASKVELVLPATGVCSTSLGVEGCC